MCLAEDGAFNDGFALCRNDNTGLFIFFALLIVLHCTELCYEFAIEQWRGDDNDGDGSDGDDGGDIDGGGDVRSFVSSIFTVSISAR